jgi:hypothetical protein
MAKVLQRLLLVVGIVGLIALFTEISLTLAATIPSSTPSQTLQVTAGPYPLTVRLYKDQALAGFALPFSIAPSDATNKQLSFDVSSVPATGVSATPVRCSISPDADTGGIRGTAELTVRGTWYLRVIANGPAGKGTVDVPLSVVAPPGLPTWLGWPLGLIPVYGALFFLLMPLRQKSSPK